jgi:hypothetical protein
VRLDNAMPGIILDAETRRLSRLIVARSSLALSGRGARSPLRRGFNRVPTRARVRAHRVLHHPPAKRPSSAACSEHGAHHLAISRAGHCIGTEFSSALLAWLTPLGIGLLVGAIVGIALASTIRLGRGSSRARPRQRRQHR